MSATIRPATMKGPAIFLAQFIGDAQPFDSFDAICGWAAGLGYKGVQVPTSDPRLIDIDKAAASQTYCDEIAGVAASHGLVITELSTHLQGQLVAVHPAYNEAFDAFAPTAVRGKPKERQIWAIDQMKKAGQASRRLGLPGSVSFTGALAWPFLYPWPQRPPGLIEPRSTNSRVAGVRSSTYMRKRASTSATRSIQARTYAMALPSRCFTSAPAITRVARSTTIRLISFCSNWTIWASSTFTPSAFEPST